MNELFTQHALAEFRQAVHDVNQVKQFEKDLEALDLSGTEGLNLSGQVHKIFRQNPDVSLAAPHVKGILGNLPQISQILHRFFRAGYLKRESRYFYEVLPKGERLIEIFHYQWNQVKFPLGESGLEE